MAETFVTAQMIYTNKYTGRTITKPARNVYHAERQARDLLRTHATDKAISKKLSPGAITLRHRDTGDTAVITWVEHTIP